MKNQKCGAGFVVWMDDAEMVADQFPVAVLLYGDTVSGRKLDRLVRNTIKGGCLIFVCVGGQSEELHDCVDDVLIERNIGGGVLTTWHREDDIEDAAIMLTTIAENGKIAIVGAKGSFKEEFQMILADRVHSTIHTIHHLPTQPSPASVEQTKDLPTAAKPPSKPVKNEP